MHQPESIHTIRLGQEMPKLINISLLPPTRGAASTDQRSTGQLWAAVMQEIIGRRLGGRDVAVIIPQPPLEWSDLELPSAAQITSMQAGKVLYRVGFVSAITAPILAEVVQSQDFLHSGCVIAALAAEPRPRVQAFLDMLTTSRAHFPAWDTWIKLPPAEILAAFAEEARIKTQSAEEWFECDNDGTELGWYTPVPDALRHLGQTLDAAINTHQWQASILIDEDQHG